MFKPRTKRRSNNSKTLSIVQHNCREKKKVSHCSNIQTRHTNVGRFQCAKHILFTVSFELRRQLNSIVRERKREKERKRFTGIANYSSRFMAIVSVQPVNNNLYKIYLFFSRFSRKIPYLVQKSILLVFRVSRRYFRLKMQQSHTKWITELVIQLINAPPIHCEPRKCAHSIQQTIKF